jgi:cytochrome c biogenesis protein CcmG, thiol:disulfide interchange protein DsbE
VVRSAGSAGAVRLAGEAGAVRAAGAAVAAIAPVLALAALAAALGACRGEVGESGEDAGAGEMAPAYAAATLDGDPVALEDLRGEVVLLNVWATWCAPCRREVPELQALHEAHAGAGLRVVGVTVDSRHALDQVHDFIREFGMTYDIWWDPDHVVLDSFRAAGVPLTVLIDRDGHVAWRHLGTFERGDPELLAAVERTLARPPPSP